MSGVRRWAGSMEVIVRIKAGLGLVIPVNGDDGTHLGALRAITTADVDGPDLIEAMSRWRGAEMAAFLTQFTSSPASAYAYLTRFYLPDPARLLFVVEDADGRAVGHMGLCNLTSQSVEVDNVLRGEPVAEPDLMFRALGALLVWSRAELGVTEAALSVLADNRRARTLYERLGFTETARTALRREPIPAGVRLVPDPEADPDSGAPELVFMGLPLKDDEAAPRLPPLRILAIGDGAIASVELMLVIPLARLADLYGVRYRLIYATDSPVVGPDETYDLVMVMRAYDRGSLAIARRLQSDGAAVIYMTDDDLELVEPDTPLGRRLTEMDAAANIRAFIDMATLTAVCSDALMTRFAERTDRLVRLPAVARRHPGRESSSPSHNPAEIRIGFAGGLVHAENLGSIAGAIRRVLNARPEVIFETIGQPLDALRGHPRYRQFDYVWGTEPFFALLSSRRWDIGVAPLIDTAFAAAKTDNKYRTYADLGIAGVYSRTPAFEGSVRDGETGLLVSNTEDAWVEAMTELLDDPQLRRRLSVASRRDTEARFSVERVADAYVAMIQTALTAPQVLVVGPQWLATMAIDARLPFARMSRDHGVCARFREVDAVGEADLAAADVLVIVRDFDPAAAALLDRAQAAGKPVIYSWDDDFFVIPDSFPELKADSERPENRKALKHILSHADLVKASTARLAERSRRYNEKVVVAPYGFDFSVLPDVKPRRGDTRVRIGYFGGARGTSFDMVVEALAQVLAERPQVEMEFFGVQPEGSERLPRSRYIPFTPDYKAAMRGLAERRWDVGLALLADDPLSQAKLPTKYRDYAATGAAGIYSRVEPYAETVRDGVNGLLVDDDVADWRSAILRLVDDADLRHRIADAAMADVRENMGIEVSVRAWNDCLERVGQPPRKPETPPRKCAVVVLGMHRSGTSAMARALSLAGCALPEVLDDDEHWEPREVARLNDRLLAEVDALWSDPFCPADPAGAPLDPAALSAARDIIRRNYGGADRIVLKEPRTNLLIDLWRDALRLEGFDPVFVVMARHPLAVARSLRVREGMAEHRALLLWIRYQLEAEVKTRADPRVFVDYQAFLADPITTVDRIVRRFGAPLSPCSPDQQAAIRDFVHPPGNEVDETAPSDALDALPHAAALYEFFAAAARNRMPGLRVPRLAAAWLDTIVRAVGPLQRDVGRTMAKMRAAAEHDQKLALALQAELSTLRSGG